MNDHSTLKQFFHPASPMGTLETLSWCWDHRYLQIIPAPNWIMPHFPQVTEVRDEQERIASLLVAILVVGIGAGSFLSYPIVNCLWYDHRGLTHCWEQSWRLYFQYQTLSLCDQGLWSVVFSNESPKSPTQFLLCRMRCFAWYCLELETWNMEKRPFNIMIKIDHDKNMLHLHYTG